MGRGESDGLLQGSRDGGATTRALERGIARLVCASTGNTAASCAAYAARAGIEAVIVVPAGAIAASKLVQVCAVGGRIHEIDGSFADAFAHAEQLAAEPGSAFVNSGGSEDRLEGQMTVAVEIAEQLGGVPEVVTLPYGGGGNTRAVARGFAELVSAAPASTRSRPPGARTRSPPRSASPSRCTRSGSARRSRAPEER